MLYTRTDQELCHTPLNALKAVYCEYTDAVHSHTFFNNSNDPAQTTNIYDTLPDVMKVGALVLPTSAVSDRGVMEHANCCRYMQHSC
jgi:hypothetical protein